MGKTVFLVRHPEAVKNLDERFASNHSNEELTAAGVLQIEHLSDEFRVLSERESWGRTLVVSAKSRRALPCGMALSEALGAPIRQDLRLTSIRAGRIAGATERDVANAMPEYFRKLSIYRRGLISSYDLAHPGEDLRQFEHRVGEAMVDLENEEFDAIVACAHKSAITAALIRYARIFHGYPADFFGFVDVPLASVSVVRVSKSAGEIVCVGVPVESVGSITASPAAMRE